MNTKEFIKLELDQSVQLFVKGILVVEDTKPCQLPFYADGFPGVIFKQSVEDAFLLPGEKRLTDFFLYGQTIKPIKIEFTAPFKLIAFQLYPFALKMLFGINPKDLNDGCFDLTHSDLNQPISTIDKLHQSRDTQNQVNILSDYLTRIAMRTGNQADMRVQSAINHILESKGNITIKHLTEELSTTERTLQRQFLNFIGVSPKQFSKIVQFQFSLAQVSKKAFPRLTDIVFESGYADQSHFIRDFKKYTGQNPKAMKRRI